MELLPELTPRLGTGGALAGRSGIDLGGTPPVTLPQIRSLLRRYKWVILLAFVGTALGTYTVLNLLNEMYETEAKLLVKIGRDQIDPPPTAKNALLVTGMRREEISTEIQILKSRALAEQVVDSIGVEAFKAKRPKPEGLIQAIKYHVKGALRAVKEQYQETLIALDLKKRLTDREKALSTVLEDLAVEPEKESDVIALRMRMPDPALARTIQDRLIEAYMLERLKVRQDRGVEQYLTGEAKDLNGTLAQIEQKQNAIKGQYGISSALEQRTLLLRQIRDLSGLYAQSNAEISALTQQREELTRQLATIEPVVRSGSQEAPNPLLQSMKEKLTTLKLQRVSASTKYQSESPVIANIDQEIARLEEMVSKQDATQVSSVSFQTNPLRQTLEQRLRQTVVDLTGIQSRAQQQRQQVAALEGELRRVDAGDVHLGQIERQRMLAEQSYISAEKRRQESEIGAELDKNRISNVSILAAPASTLEPVYPRKLLIMGIALVLGLLLGLGLSLLMDYMDDRIHDPKQVENALMLPCLATVRFGGAAKSY